MARDLFCAVLRIRQHYIPFSTYVNSSIHLGTSQHGMLGNAVPTSKAIKSGWQLEKPNNAGVNHSLSVRQTEKELSVVFWRVGSGTRLPVFKS